MQYLGEYARSHLEAKKDIWWQMILLLPSSYNQKRTVMMSYEVLANIYKSRKNHKLDEWSNRCPNDSNTCGGIGCNQGFIGWIEELPYSELITGTDENSPRGLRSLMNPIDELNAVGLIYPISPEDIRKAIFSFEPDKETESNDFEGDDPLAPRIGLDVQKLRNSLKKRKEKTNETDNI